MSKWFYDTSTGAALEHPAVVLLWGWPLASWLLALGERGGHEDLRSSGRLSIIYPISMGELSCIVLKPALPEPFFSFDPLEVAPARAFYSSRSGSYSEPPRPDRWPQGR
jgi:hypothetical protein